MIPCGLVIPDTLTPTDCARVCCDATDCHATCKGRHEGAAVVAHRKLWKRSACARP